MPELYRKLEGITKKRFAWAYLKKLYPECEPYPDQPDLEEKNVLYCKIKHH